MADWVLAVERAYVAAATSKQPVGAASDEHHGDQALAALGAVASRYLAVGTPRTLGLVVDAATSAAAALSIEAHRTWFSPPDIRCAGGDVAGARPVSLKEALACDIVCVHAPTILDARDIRRGTHLNVLTATATVGDELATIAVITHEWPGLGDLAAGFVDGRQLDEITVFLAEDAAIARAAIARNPSGAAGT